jgi:hypothetical protein
MEEDKSWKDYVFEQPIDAKRTYKYEKDYNHDISYENERKHNNVHSPSHYKHGNVLKYVSRYKFKGEPLQDLEKAQWYLNRLIKEVNNGAS